MATMSEIAWLSGMLEGEGGFFMHSPSEKYRGTPSISMATTDRDIINRVATLLGTNAMGPYRPYHGNKKATYQLIICGRKAIGWMFTLYPFMGERRCDKIRELVGIWKTLQTIAPERKPICHPDKQYFAKGFCKRCYNHNYRKERIGTLHIAH